MRLTQKDIVRANKRRKYSDGRGLFLSVSANGRKTWAFVYRFPDASAAKGYREREMGLGSIDFVSVDEARDRAVQLRRMVRDGLDPLAERKREERAVVRVKATGVTFREVAERVIEKKRPEWSDSGKSEASWRGSFAKHAFPALGDKPVNEIERGDVRDMIAPVWTSVPVTAQRLLQRVEEVFEFAALEGLRTGENPADRHKLRRMLPKAERVHRARSHAALAYSDVPAFVGELRTGPGVSRRALEFLILTAARTKEVIGATWEEIDLDAATWTIPAARMKAGRDHRVPLSAPAVALLRALPAEEGNPHVFISPTKKGSGLSDMAMLKLLQSEMKRDDVTVHGFRSAFRDWTAEETSHGGDVAEMALAHTISNKVEAAYRRGDLFEKRRALMRDWATFCDVR